MSYRRSVIKSIQTGSIALADNATSATATITAVVLANSMVQFGGYKSSMVIPGAWSGYNPNQLLVAVDLTNTTTVTATKDGTSGPNSEQYTVRFTVIEFYPGVVKSRGTGAITIATGATTNTATITAVVVAKTIVYCTGVRNSGDGTQTPAQVWPDVVLTNTTTITSTRGASSGSFTSTARYQYVEFN